MIDTAVISGLKRTNVSENFPKTMERVKIIWQSVSREEKLRLLKEADIKERTIYRTISVGAITPKTVIFFASTFDCDPFYLTGETDESAGYDEKTLDRFLRSKGYDKLLDSLEWKPKRKYTRRTADAQTDVSAPNVEYDSTIQLNAETPETSEEYEPLKGNSPDITEDDQILLLRALNVRAQHNVNAKDQLEAILNILLDQ